MGKVKILYLKFLLNNIFVISCDGMKAYSDVPSLLQYDNNEDLELSPKGLTR